MTRVNSTNKTDIENTMRSSWRLLASAVNLLLYASHHGEALRVLVGGVSTHVSSVYPLVHELIVQGHNVDLCVIPDDWKKAQKEFKNYDEAADQKVRNICSIGLTPEEEAEAIRQLQEQIASIQWMDPIPMAIGLQLFSFAGMLMKHGSTIFCGTKFGNEYALHLAHVGMRATSDLLYDSLVENVSNMPVAEKPQVFLIDAFFTSLFDAAEVLGIKAIGIDMGAGQCSLEMDHAVKFMLPYTGRHLTYMHRFTNNAFHWAAPILRLPVTIWSNIQRYNRGLSLQHEYGDYWLRVPMVSPQRVSEMSEPQYRSPAYEFLGAMSVPSEPPPLSGPIKTWVDRMVKEGKKIVYVSFGTNLVVDERMMDILAPTAQRLTKELNMAVLWSIPQSRWDLLPKDIRPADNTPVDTSTNVLVVPFAPQTSVLHHYNVHVFLTHGGLNSICESLIAGTPLVLLPFMGDQLENAAKIDAIGAGIMINKFDATPTAIVETIEYVANNDKYITNTVAMRQLLVEEGGSKKGVKVIEKTALGWYDERLPIGPSLPLYQRLSIDIYVVYAAMFSVTMLAVLLGMMVVWFVLAYLLRRDESKPKEE